MTMETTKQKSPNTDELTKNEQVEENIDQHTDEPTVANEQIRQEGAESDVDGGEGLQKYREQLKQRLDEELTNLEATQGKVVDRLKANNEFENIADSDFNMFHRKELTSCQLSGVSKDKLKHRLN